MVGPDTVPRRRLGARVRKYRGKLFVATADRALELDECAEFVFRQVDGSRTVRQIGEQVAVTYGISLDRAVRDSAGLLVELAGHQIMDIDG
ncbi:PqqD family protein [Dactylosporangium sp. NPDC051484]|uniref:PqqD family protein n=1 Tax=Dactylosporangium sp. NPDC051484 TaxID=3154942 RepID=UPI003450F0CD